jgi:hypothetical protein
MARFGSNINPSLGAVNYTPYMQGALAGSQSIAQGIATLGQIAGKSINDYYAKKEEEKKKDEAANSFIKTVEANPAAFQSYMKDGKIDKDAVRSMVDTLGVPGMLQLNTYLADAAKQQKTEKLKTESAKYSEFLTKTQGEDNTGASFMGSLRSFQEGQFSPEAKLAGRQMNLETRKTEAQIRELESRTSGVGGEPTSAMKNARVITDSEVARGLITPQQAQTRYAELVAQGGVENFSPGGIFKRADGTGDPIVTVTDGRGRYYTEDANGNRTRVNLGEWAPASRTDSTFLSPEAFAKMGTELTNKRNQIDQINTFLETTEGLEKGGLERKISSFTSRAKRILDLPLTKEEEALGASRAMQQRLLGAIKNEVLGPGVLTDQDAERLFAAMGGDVESALTNIDAVRKTLASILNEKHNLYKQEVQMYNHNAKEKYTYMTPFEEIPLYKISQTPPVANQGQAGPSSGRILRMDAGRLIPVNQGGASSGYNVMDTIFQGRR